MGWWKRFSSMPDAKRARLLAWIFAALLMMLIYALGGASLYVQRHYLTPLGATSAAAGVPTAQSSSSAASSAD